MSEFTLYPYEPYDPCCCNSGAKFRFCCFRNIKTFEKAVELADENKFDRALEILNKA